MTDVFIVEKKTRPGLDRTPQPTGRGAMPQPGQLHRHWLGGLGGWALGQSQAATTPAARVGAPVGDGQDGPPLSTAGVW
jgi:hypothetical protein